MPASHILTYAQTMSGGVEAALGRLLQGWLDRGRRVTLVLGRDAGQFRDMVPRGVEIVTLGHDHYVGLAAALPLLIEQTRPDILFCPGNHYTSMAAYARLRLADRCPPIVAKMSNAVDRGDHSAWLAWGQRQWLALHGLFLDTLVAMTPATARAAQEATGMSVAVIPNPPAALPGGVPDQPLLAERRILGVGRLEPQKRWDRLLDALPRLADAQVKLLLLGEGAARAALDAQIAALGLGDRVIMPGHAGDPLPALRGAAVAVLTSDYEGVPGVLREALSVGTPVVSTESSVAVREIVHAPELGTVIAREDGDALVAALDHWLAPDAVRPAPVTATGDPIADYLALFDRMVDGRRR